MHARNREVTAQLRDRWLRSQPSPVGVGTTLSIQRLPLHVIRQRLSQRSEPEAAPRQWRTPEERRRIEMERSEFQRKWIHEVIKRDEGFHHRLPYVRDVAPPTLPPREYTWCSNRDTRPFFYLSDKRRPCSDHERDRRTRHFVHPEWNSETISWARLHSAGVKELHKISLFG